MLKFVGLQLCHQPDSAPFLLLVDQNAGTRSGNHRKCKLELLATVAAQGMKHIAREALGMNANQRRSRMDIAHDQGDGFFNRPILLPVLAWSMGRAGLSAEAIDAKLSPASRKSCRGYLVNYADPHPCIIAGTNRSTGSLPTRRLSEGQPLALKWKIASCLDAMAIPFRV